MGRIVRRALVAASVYRGKTYQQSRALDMLICPAFDPALALALTVWPGRC